MSDWAQRCRDEAAMIAERSNSLVITQVQESVLAVRESLAELGRESACFYVHIRNLTIMSSHDGFLAVPCDMVYE